MPSNFFIGSILKGERDVSTYKNSFFEKLLMQRSMKWFKMFLFLTKVLYLLPLSAYSCIDSFNFSFISWRWCLLFKCLLFAGKKSAAGKSFIFKLFWHWPKHDVHNECMFDYDQLNSHLKGKSVSIDISVNSLMKNWINEKVLNNRKIILAITDPIKLCGRIGIALCGHRDASKYHPEIGQTPILAGVINFVRIINYAIRSGNKVLENHLETCNKHETFLKLLSSCYQILTEGLLKEVKDV